MANKALAKYDKQLDKIYSPQVDLINKQYQAQLPQFAAEEASLKQAKLNAFRDIGDIAQRRGMFFSGFQPTEQARYVGEKFLPGLAKVAQGRQQLSLNRLESLTGIRTQKAEKRLSFREQLRQEAVQRARDKQAHQNSLELQSRSSSGGRSGGGTYGSSGVGQAFSAIAGEMHKLRGKDGKVSPSTFKNARAEWSSAGFKTSDFDKQFAYLVNPSHWWNYGISSKLVPGAKKRR